MSNIQQRIADITLNILIRELPTRKSTMPDLAKAIAAVLVSELGLTRETFTLIDHSKNVRHVTDWIPE